MNWSKLGSALFVMFCMIAGPDIALGLNNVPFTVTLLLNIGAVAFFAYMYIPRANAPALYPGEYPQQVETPLYEHDHMCPDGDGFRMSTPSGELANIWKCKHKVHSSAYIEDFHAKKDLVEAKALLQKAQMENEILHAELEMYYMDSVRWKRQHLS